MWVLWGKGPSGFSSSSTAEEVTKGIDASGLTAIVTGGSSGIGLETTRVLAKRGVHVIMGIRNMPLGKTVKERIIKENPFAKVDAMELDLSSLQSVTNFASQFKSSALPLNILINNAGVTVPTFTLSPHNIELHFATKYLGHFLLTHSLLDTMKKTARDSKREGRIVNLSSLAHRFSYKGIRFDKINDEKSYSACVQSKLATILHTNELARRLKEEKVEITANSVHSVVVATNLFRNAGILRGVLSMVDRLVFKNVQQGASTTCYVALHTQLKGISGEYFSHNNLDKAAAVAADKDLAAQLWDFSIDTNNEPFYYYNRLKLYKNDSFSTGRKKT